MDGGAFLHLEVQILSVIESGLYTVKDKFFKDFPGYPYMDNKLECRPYYYLLKDTDEILWVVPMSTKVETYKRKIERIEAKRGKGNCIFYHVGVIAGIERAFSIGDMFPVTAEYINAPFTIDRIHYIVKNENLRRAIHSRAMKFLRLVEKGIIHSELNIMETKRELINRRKIQAP